ncbi:MAG: DNA replication and repair protein RecF, partial [Eubacteriales bacterium]|nr:DNA replication and repair protein RecF [Eubacteriales bacterium]
MEITRVTLHQFRCYETLLFTPAPSLNLLVGDNAAGKTTVLEALFLCALGRSHRTRYSRELIRRGEDAASVSLAFQKRSGSHEIVSKLFLSERRDVRVDGKALTLSGELLGCLNVVLFSPEDLRLVQQGPTERRRFLDMELSQLDSGYYYALQRYNQALKQRNAMLKDEHPDLAVLAVYDTQLAVQGADIMLAREAFLEKLSVRASTLHGRISGERDELTVAYQPSVA